MPPQARLGDKAIHLDGGSATIISGASTTTVDGVPAARVGDKAVCSKHGMVSVAKGSSTVMIEGKPAARVGDKLSCGAIISKGSGTTNTN